MPNDDTLIEVRNLVKHFPIKGGILPHQVDSIKAVNGVSFAIKSGETFGLVGESGCGKSTLGNVIVGLETPTSGEVLFDGTNVHVGGKRNTKRFRQDLQIVFQDPFESLNPRMTVGEIVSEGLKIQTRLSKKEIQQRVLKMLSQVGLKPEHYSRYPHEFSGGQRQRIGIARALIVSPKFIVCDEPVSALDVCVQAQIINLLSDLQKEFGFAYLFIAHGLGVVRHLSDRIGVMYLGKIVEVAKSEEIFDNPKHPYTQALLSAIPEIIPKKDPFSAVISGDVPSSIKLPTGCPFHPRCEKCMEICKQTMPELKRVGDSEVLCHLY